MPDEPNDNREPIKPLGLSNEISTIADVLSLLTEKDRQRLFLALSVTQQERVLEQLRHERWPELPARPTQAPNVNNVLALLSEKDREILIAKFQGESFADIAARFQTSAESVTAMWHRSSQRLLDLFRHPWQGPTTGAMVTRPISRSTTEGADFQVTFSPELSAEQVKGGLEAIAEYYRACGGIGLAIDLDGVEVAVREPSFV